MSKDDRDFRAQPAPAKKPVKQSGPPRTTQPQKAAKKPHLVEPVNAKTSGGSAATTAVIPPVKDKPASKPTTTAPSAKSARPERQRETSATSQSGRRASLRLDHVEPWSVTRLTFVVSVAMMIVAVVAVSIFWVVLNITGVWDQINDSVTSVLSDDSGSFDITDYLGFGRLVGLTLVLSAINVILMTALATIGAHLYNLAAELLGGLEVTFSDD